MAFSSAIKTSLPIFLILLLTVTVTVTVTGQYIPPVFSPFFENVCNDVECGKGTCQTALVEPFNFVCNCQQGWRRLREGDETNLQFLPCIIPNCSLDYSCMPMSTPPPPPSVPNNLSFYDPCHWMYCGEGTCRKNSTYTHVCQCNPGQSNILDFPVYPCYSQCSLGTDCTNLGIKVDKSSTSPSTPAAVVSSNSPIDANLGNPDPAISLFPGKLQWMGFVLIFGVMLFWKQGV